MQGSRALPFVVAGLSVVTGATVFVLVQHFTRATRSVAAPPRSISNDAALPNGDLIALRTPEAYSTPLSSTQAASGSPQPVTTRPVSPFTITATNVAPSTTRAGNPGSVARAIDITTSTGRRGTRLDTASIAREIARLKPTLEACYAAPECSQTHSVWCIDSVNDKRVVWTLFVAEDGHVDRSQHIGVGMQAISCGGHALDTLHLPPYAQERNKSMDTLEVVITIQ